MDSLLVRESKLPGGPLHEYRNLELVVQVLGCLLQITACLYQTALSVVEPATFVGESLKRTFSVLAFLDVVNFVTLLRHTKNSSLCKLRVFEDPSTRGASLTGAGVSYLV